MLVTDPRQRATLGEILNHSWITKGFNTPPENYLPHREPLQLPLDPEVIEKMTGFDFGPSEFITRELTKVISSEEYQTAVRLNTREQSTTGTGGEKRRGVFDFYKRRNSVTSRDMLLNLSAEAVQLGSDPMNAFSPLISVYYLVREKKEREQLESNPGGLSMPISPGEKPLRIPDLPAPEAAYTNPTTYEMPGEKITGGRSRPRSRTHGEDDVAESLKKVNLNAGSGHPAPAAGTHQTETPQPRKESAAAGLLRRFSTRRNKESSKARTESQNPPALQLQPPTDTPAPARKSFSVRRSRNKDPAPSLLLHAGGSTPHHQPDLLTPPATFGGSSRGGSTLDRSASVNSVDHRRRQSRRGVSEGNPTIASQDPPMTSGSEKSSTSGQNIPSTEQGVIEPQTNATTRAAALRTKSLGHTRRESMHQRAPREEIRGDNLAEEEDHDAAVGKQRPSKADSLDNTKPVYLKGLFSVSTTSNKPLPFIRADIVRVLQQLGVDYVEIKGGFDCKHVPSINLNRISESNSPNAEQQMTPTLGHRRRISFLGSKNADRDRDELREHEKSSPALRGNLKKQAPNTSFTNSEVSEESLRPPQGERAAGETSTHVQTEAGKDMVLKFEIFIVKVPLFSLHGIQFKKVAGDTWAYKNMAQKILNALRL